MSATHVSFARDMLWRWVHVLDLMDLSQPYAWLVTRRCARTVASLVVPYLKIDLYALCTYHILDSRGRQVCVCVCVSNVRACVPSSDKLTYMIRVNVQLIHFLQDTRAWRITYWFLIIFTFVNKMWRKATSTSPNSLPICPISSSTLTDKYRYRSRSHSLHSFLFFPPLILL